MTTYSAGNFKIEVGPPSPVWCRLTFSHQDGEIHGIKHTDLPDLLHVVQRAIADAKRQLGPAANEVE